MQGEIQLRPLWLVRNKEISLTGTGRPAGHRTPIEHRHPQPGPRGIPGARRTDDTSADDDHIRGHVVNMSHVMPCLAGQSARQAMQGYAPSDRQMSKVRKVRDRIVTRARPGLVRIKDMPH
jgi:hypothetical protein